MSDQDHIDPKMPHPFVEKLNMPFAVPRAAVSGSTGPEYTFRRDGAPGECGLCGKGHSDRIHESSDHAANEEHWPV